MSKRTNERNYIYLQDKDVKVKLLAKKGYWDFNIKGEYYSIPASLERYYAYMIFSEKNTGEVASTIRLTKKNISPDQIDDFVNHFIETHELESVEFELENIPVYATERTCIEIAHPFNYNVLLSKKQEIELLAIVSSEETKSIEPIKQWFFKYRKAYGLDAKLKKDKLIQDEELALQFCRQHGINPFDLNKHKYDTETHTIIYSKERSFVLWMFSLFVYCFAGYLTICAYNFLFDADWFGYGDNFIFAVGSCVLIGGVLLHAGLTGKKMSRCKTTKEKPDIIEDIMVSSLFSIFMVIVNIPIFMVFYAASFMFVKN